MSPEIKICGIRTPDAFDAALAGRASHVGLNFYAPSPRSISPTEAAALAARNAGRTTLVGVFVDADDATIRDAVRAGFDAIQLHGSESPQRAAELRAALGKPVWKVISVASAADLPKAEAYAGAADFILFDAKTPKGQLPGGMGLAFDWSLLSAWRGRMAWGLAGGLNPGNVAEAIACTGAPLVDVSSGVESAPGVKDTGLIETFCRAARTAL